MILSELYFIFLFILLRIKLFIVVIISEEKLGDIDVFFIF